MKKFSVSAIVPAYNEEKKIANVLRVLVASIHINEVICVNDGSSDNTYNIINGIKGITRINLNKNRGKAYAVSIGIEKAKGDVIVMIDADISGLNDDELKILLHPVLSGNFSGSIGYPCVNKFDAMCIPISGERAYFKKDLIPYTKKMDKKGYGLELYLNYIFRDKKIAIVPLKGIKHPIKTQKQPYKTVIRQMAIQLYQMGKEILKEPDPFMYFYEAYLYQFYIKKRKPLSQEY